MALIFCLYSWVNMLFNVLNVWFSDISPAAIKNEPEEDNGFYPSPQHNKASRRKSDDEEFVPLVFNYCTSLTCDSILWCMWLACLLADSSTSPKKLRRSMIKSQRKGNMSMKKKKMTMMRRYLCLFVCWFFFGVYAFIFSMLEGSFLRSVLSCFRTSNPRRRRKTKM